MIKRIDHRKAGRHKIFLARFLAKGLELGLIDKAKNFDQKKIHVNAKNPIFKVCVPRIKHTKEIMLTSR